MTITQAMQGVLSTEALECPSVGLCYNLNQLGLLTNKCQAFCVLYPHVYVLALSQLFFWSFSLGGQFRFLDGRTVSAASHYRGHLLRSIPFLMSGHLNFNFFLSFGYATFETKSQ